jgi:hypothetical protein
VVGDSSRRYKNADEADLTLHIPFDNLFMLKHLLTEKQFYSAKVRETLECS